MTCFPVWSQHLACRSSNDISSREGSDGLLFASMLPKECGLQHAEKLSHVVLDLFAVGVGVPESRMLDSYCW